MSITTTPLSEITWADVAALIGAPADPRRLAILAALSRTEAAVAAASLANTSGGLLVIGAQANLDGVVTGLPGAAVSQADISAISEDLGPVGRHLVQDRVVKMESVPVCLVAVDECATPPVLVETNGRIYRRDETGVVRVLSRLQLDELLSKERRLRAQAESNIDAMLGRVSFGHFNYLTIAIAAAPRLPTNEPYRRISQDPTSLADGSNAFGQRWGFARENVHTTAGEIEVELPSEETGFVRVARNGCVAAGVHLRRPAQDRFLSPAEFSSLITEAAETVATILGASRSGAVGGSIFLEGVRDLRLPVGGAVSAPVARDLVHEYIPERYVQAPDEREAFVHDAQKAIGNVFNVDLQHGAVQRPPLPSKTRAKPRSWHGMTMRTERGQPAVQR